MLRRVHRERVIGLAGPRALLMQAAHPLAVAGLLAHSSALDEPYDRLARTAQVMHAIGFGSRAEANEAARRVRAMSPEQKAAQLMLVGFGGTDATAPIFKQLPRRTYGGLMFEETRRIFRHRYFEFGGWNHMALGQPTHPSHRGHRVSGWRHSTRTTSR